MNTDNINVVIRAKPYVNGQTTFLPWVIRDNTIHQKDEENSPIGEVYSFDEIFNVDKHNVDVYTRAISPLVDLAIQGINITIFAYGATSSGKTYTMNGISEDPGVIPRFVKDLFNEIDNSSHRKFLLRVSYVEIYGEVINDLLDKNSKDLKIREDYNNFVTYNPKEIIIKSCQECMRFMEIGSANRKTGETQMNAVSSRSHSIFRIVIESTPAFDNENDPVKVSHVHLIDLAGSERVSQTLATGQRFKEAAHINKSLTALGLVMKQLVEKSDYINYRDSKLTRILSNSLGGNAKTFIICNINLMSIEDTASTLMFAQRAKAVKNKPKVNVVLTEASLTKKYAKECLEMKKLLEMEFDKNKKLVSEQALSSQKIKELLSQIQTFEGFFVNKSPVKKRPKRRHTLGAVLGAISEERELESSSIYSTQDECIENSSIKTDTDMSTASRLSERFENDNVVTPRSTRKSNTLEETPVNILRERCHDLSREYHDLLKFTNLEKSMKLSVERDVTQKLEHLEEECEDLRAYRRNAESKIELLLENQERYEQISNDFEFVIESQKKKFEKREKELLEQIEELSSRNFRDVYMNDDIPLSGTPTNIFEFEEMFENHNSLKKQMEELQNTNELLNIQLLELRSANNSYQTENIDLKNVINNMQDERSKQNTENKQLMSQLARMKSTLDAFESNRKCSEDIFPLKRQITELQLCVDNLNIELVKVKQDLFESQDKLIEVTEDLDIEEKKTSKLEKELEAEKILRKETEMKYNEQSSRILEGFSSGLSPETLDGDIMIMLHKLKSILDPPKPAQIEATNSTDSNTSILTITNLHDTNETEMLDKSSNDTLEISSQTIRSFSTSYLENTKETQDFMSFFQSFVSDTSPIKSNVTESGDEEIRTKEENLLETIKNMKSELDSIRKDRARDITMIMTLQKKLEEYSNINLSDSEKIEKTNKTNKKDIEILQAENTKCSLLIENLKKESDHTLVKNVELQERLVEKCSELEQKEKELHSLLKNNDILQSQVLMLNNDRDKERNEQNEIIEKLTGELEKMKLHKTNIDQEVCQKNHDNMIIQDALKSEVETKNKIIEQLKREIHVSKDDFLNQHSKYEEKLRIATDEMERMKIETDKLITLLQEKCTVIETSVSDKNILIQEKAELVSALKQKDITSKLYLDENYNLLDEIDLLNRDNRSQKVEIDKQRDLIAKLESDLKKGQQLNAENADKIEYWQNKFQSENVKIKSMEEKITKLENDHLMKLKKITGEQENEIKNFSNQIENLRIENENLLSSLKEKDVVIEETLKKSYSLQELNEDLSTKISQMKLDSQLKIKDHNILLSEIKILKKEIDAKDVEINVNSQLIHDLKEKLGDAQVNKHKNTAYHQSNSHEIQRLNTTVQNLKDEIQSNRLVIANQKQELENKQILKPEEFCSKDEETRLHSDIIGRLKTKNEDILISLKEKNVLIEKQSKEVDSCNNQITRLRNILSHISLGTVMKDDFIFRRCVDKAKQLEFLVDKVTSLVEDHNLLKQQNETGYKTLEVLNNKLSMELKVKTKKYENLSEDHETLKKEYEKVSGRFDVALRDLNCLENRLAELTSKYEENELKYASLTFEHQKSLDRLIQLEKRVGEEKHFNTSKSKEMGNLDVGSLLNNADISINKPDVWKRHRTEVHDSRRSIDLNTLHAETTVEACSNCDQMNGKLRDLKFEVSKLKKHIVTRNEDLETLRTKYESLKRLCRLRHEEIQILKQK